VQSTTQDEAALLQDIEPTQIQLQQTSRLPLYYRHTAANITTPQQVMSDGIVWQNVSGFRDGHSTMPEPGFHWYALKVRGEQLRNIEWFLALQSNWWTDIGAWAYDIGPGGNEEPRVLTRMDTLGVRYRLMIAAESTSTILIRFRVNGPTLSRAEYFFIRHHTGFIEASPVILGSFLGFMLLVLIYNFGYFILIREKTYLYFALSTLGLTLLVGNEFGVWQFAGVPGLSAGGVLAWLSIAAFFAGLMIGRITSDIMAVDKWQRALKVWLGCDVAFWLLWSSFGVTEFLIALFVVHFLIGLTCIALVFIGWRKGELFMGTLLVALLPITAMAVFVPIIRSGLLPNFIGTDYFHITGIVFFEAVVCSLLPLRFKQESISRDLLGKSLQEKEARLDEVSIRLEDISETFSRLREEDDSTREALIATQQARIDTEKRLRDAHHQLRHLEYYVSLGRLVAGVAHDIANPATHISGCAQNFRKLISDLDGIESSTLDPEMIKNLYDASKTIDEKSAYIVRVNQALARYGRIDDSVSAGVDLKRLCEQVLYVVASRLYMHEVDCDLDGLPSVTVKAGQVSQLLSNLILNAADAASSVEGRGRVVIWGELENQQGCDGISLVVEDTGPGIPEMVHRAGIRPFVTTRDPSHWLGIGLSIVKRIVNEHGGEMWFPPPKRLHGGAVRVWLPLGQIDED